MNLVNGNSQILVILDLFLNPNKVWKLGPVQFRPGVPGVDTATYLLSFYLTANKTADPHIRYLHFVFIVYGYFQSLLGFIAGLVLARTTQGTTYAQINKEAEEEETLIDNS